MANLEILIDDDTMEDLFDFIELKEADRVLVARSREPVEASLELMRWRTACALDKVFRNLKDAHHQEYTVIASLPEGHKDRPRLIELNTQLKARKKAEVMTHIETLKALFARIPEL